MIDGIIQYLLSEATEACKLRNSFVFKIVPMLNPDGVIIGNYRCSLAPYDLNRQWINPKKSTCPEIFAIKNVCLKEIMIDNKEDSRYKESINVL